MRFMLFLHCLIYSMELIECSTDLLALNQNIKNLCTKPQKKQNPLQNRQKKKQKKSGQRI